MANGVKLVDYATPTLKRLYWLVENDRRRALMAKLGAVGVTTMKEHFSQRDSEGNKRGWSYRSHFWMEISDATGLTQVTSTEAKITVADPRFAAKRFGATIRPKRAKALALPLNSKAKEAGKPSGNEIAGLFLVKGKKGKAWLAARDGERLTFYYQLLRKVQIEADPRALPEPFYINFQMVNAAREFLQEEAAKRRPPETN